MRIGMIFAVGAAMGLSAPVHAQTHYVATALKFGETFSFGCVVQALSDAGLAAGICLDGVHQVPAMWDAQGNQTLLPTPSDAQLTWVSGINSAGQVCASYEDGAGVLHALRWDNGQFKILDGAGSSSVANGINESGDIVGSLNNAATVWKHDGSVVLLLPPEDPGHELASTSGQAINDLGVVAGAAAYFGSPYSFSNPVLWQRRRPVVLPQAIQSGSGAAIALNVRGTAVGYVVDSSGGATAWMWTAAQATPLPGLPDNSGAVAQGINRADVVVGYSVGSDGILNGVKWQGGRTTRLDAVSTGFPVPGGFIWQASAVNNHGWIAASYSVQVPPYNYPVILKPAR